MPQVSSPNPPSRRKAQNAAAQRRYRQKQKERLEKLQQLAISAVLSQETPSVSLSPSSSSDETTGREVPSPGSESATATTITTTTAAVEWQQSLSQLPPPGGPPAVAGAPHDVRNRNRTTTTTRRRVPPDDEIIRSSDLCFIAGYPREQLHKFFHMCVREGLGLRDFLRYGLILMGSCMHPAIFDSGLSLSTRRWFETVQSDIGDVNMKAALITGAKFLLGLAGTIKLPPTVAAFNPNAAAAAAADLCRNRLCRNRIHMPIITYGAVVSIVAPHLGYSYETLADPTTTSHFTGVPPSAEWVERIKPDLRPTEVQRTVRHHGCFDLIPLPALRSNAILAAAADPPLIDEEEFFLDVCNDGIRCWGSAAGSLHGRGEGAPWDARTWEAAPWFLEKWEMLTDGPEGDLWRTSLWWWQQMRGGGGVS